MNQNQLEIPIQPVERPILCNPYEEPSAHWVYDTKTGEAIQHPGRREAGYWYKTQRTGTEQLQMRFVQEEERDDLPLVNALRADVKRWRESNYRNATNVTRDLLNHWTREDKERRLFFCQREAVETIIWLAEIRRAGKRTGFNPQFTNDNLDKLVDTPEMADLPELIRYGCKMATGSGKTVVMAMLIAWAFCNRGKVPSDDRFPKAALVVCPNLTIKERLQVLRPESSDNYYDAFELIPTKLRPLLNSGKVLVTNWHQFALESPQAEGGSTYSVVNKGEETPDAFSRRVLGELYERAPIMVLNDEGHHAYRPAPIDENENLSGAEKSERQDATVWITGLDRINAACGVRFCVDLSATPTYIHGSGHPEGTPFPWLVSDFGLVDAIESGITKIPRLPVSDTTGRPEPKYFRLWRAVNDQILPGDRLPGKAKKPKPEAVYREAQDALNTLASQWKERFEYIEQASDAQDKTPPVMIIVCDNTNIAELVFRKISGEDEVEDIAENSGKGKKKKATKTAYGQGAVFPDLLSNDKDVLRTLRIDSKMLADAESEETGKNKAQAAEDLRQIVATIGKPGKPGEQVRCVVSVAMLNEGWDANNVTHILGLRAFTSQLLCEQVVGRGLRRMNYTPDPETGLLTEEYVDVYGIPFSVIPFKGRTPGTPAPDLPKNHVRAMPERKCCEIRFPVVEGYAFALRKNEIKADIKAMELLFVEPEQTPTAVFVKPAVGYETGNPSALGPGQFEEQNRQEYYRTTHIQAIKFEIARRIVLNLVGGGDFQPDSRSNPKLRLQSRHRLFPQVYRLVDAYVGTKVDFHGCNPCEIGHEKYTNRIVERLMAAIQPNEVEGETPLLPILNRYKPIGTSAEVDFMTTRSCHGTERSQINQVVLDTETWESSACFRLEQSDVVDYYVRNDHLGLGIPYEYTDISHSYEPDFIVRLKNEVNLIVEIKGHETEQDRAKHDGARRWVSAVNNWNELGKWDFHVCRDPQLLERELAYIVRSSD